MPSNTEAGFTFDYITILNLAREFDSNPFLPKSHLAVGLVGHEIFRFAQRLKKELVGDDPHPMRRTTDVSPELVLALARVGQLEAEIAELKAKLLLATTAAVSAAMAPAMI